MPSLHTASAILMFLALRNSPLWHRVIMFAAMICIILSTIILGEHYAVDLIAALPLVLLARGLCAIYLPINLAERRNAIIAGAALTILWVLTVRGAPLSLEVPFLVRVLALLSIVLPALLEYRLAKAERADVQVQVDYLSAPAPVLKRAL